MQLNAQLAKRDNLCHIPYMKSLAPNPKANLIRSVARSVAPTFRRYYGEVGRALVNPNSAKEVANEALHSLTIQFKSELAKTALPVVTCDEPVPAGAHWLVAPISRMINFTHGRLPVCCAMAHVDENGECAIGAVYFPIEDVLVLAEKGLGSIGPDRLRANTRDKLDDALLCLPFKTADVISMDIVRKCEADGRSIHTRKTGDTFFDVIDVAAGRADVVVATRLTRLEALVAKLILAESGAAATDLKGKPLTGASDTLLATPLKLHAAALDVFGQ